MYATLEGSASVETARAIAERFGAASSGTARLPLLEEQVCAEAGLWAPDAAATAIAQAGGDVPQAVSLLKVWAAALPHLAAHAIAPEDIRIVRRLSSAYAEVPGGQWLGFAPELASRLLSWHKPDGSAGHDGDADHGPDAAVALPDPSADDAPSRAKTPLVRSLLRDLPVGRVPDDGDGHDPAVSAPVAPFARATRLGVLARGETASIVALAALILSQRREAVLAELTTSSVGVRVPHPRTGTPCLVARVPVVEADTIIDAEVDGRPGFAVGWGASMGSIERRAISLALLDGAMQADVDLRVPLTLDEQTVVTATDGSANNGFVEHLRLPHHASFASYAAQASAHQHEESE